ncbi:MAG: alanine:cation symporter family protein, partial [Bacilli bacterium]
QSKLSSFYASLEVLSPSAIASPIQIIMSLCYGLFAFSTILGMIAFVDVCSNEISRSKGFSIFTKLLCSAVFVPFGVVSVWSGLELDNLWLISDFVNLMMVVINIPLLIIGRDVVIKALKHYEKKDKTKFTGSVVGYDLDYWDHQ